MGSGFSILISLYLKKVLALAESGGYNAPQSGRRSDVLFCSSKNSGSLSMLLCQTSRQRVVLRHIKKHLSVMKNVCSGPVYKERRLSPDQRSGVLVYNT